MSVSGQHGYTLGWIWFAAITLTAFAAVVFSYADMPLLAVICAVVAILVTVRAEKKL